MKLYAQHGYGVGEKITLGLEDDFIDGVIYSPRDIKKSKLKSELSLYKETGADLLLDPQFYVSLYNDEPNVKKRHLDTWKYFKGYKKSQLETSSNIRNVLDKFYGDILDLNITSIITPNIYITKSFNSAEAVIAKNFIREAKDVQKKHKDKREVYASLIIDWEAFFNKDDFEEFLDDLTQIQNKPEGIYLIIGSQSIDPQEDFFVSDVISGWLKLNYALTINGYKVINGYSDLLTPLLGTVGAYAGATGWWSNLRFFKMDRFIPSTSGGGKIPIIRYLSNLLFNRIKFAELEAASVILPKIKNNLECDKYYNPEPDSRGQEMLQSWEALKSMINTYCTNQDDVDQKLKNFTQHLKDSQKAYDTLRLSNIRFDKKSNDDHLPNIISSIKNFKEWAEI